MLSKIVIIPNEHHEFLFFVEFFFVKIKNCRVVLSFIAKEDETKTSGLSKNWILSGYHNVCPSSTNLSKALNLHLSFIGLSYIIYGASISSM